MIVCVGVAGLSSASPGTSRSAPFDSAESCEWAQAPNGGPGSNCQADEVTRTTGKLFVGGYGLSVPLSRYTASGGRFYNDARTTYSSDANGTLTVTAYWKDVVTATEHTSGDSICIAVVELPAPELFRGARCNPSLSGDLYNGQDGNASISADVSAGKTYVVIFSLWGMLEGGLTHSAEFALDRIETAFTAT
ncbi:MAG: hypothetical protein LC750_08635 [Actinobacteria bacterium]|nr:hypothetical protein [Actinomycetota bacterium]